MAALSRLLVRCAPLTLVLLLVSSAPAMAQWQIGDEAKTSIKFGLLLQPRAEIIDGDDTAQNLFIRRLRILAGGTLAQNLTFFFETDSPNLGKGDAAGNKNTGDVFIQDFVVSYAFAPDNYIDVGMILPALSHNSGQSAASRMAVDYGDYSFLASGPTGSRVGRDYGLRARGYVLNDKLEYRAGIYQGARGVNSSNELRLVGRAVFNVFEAEKGLFYSGTNLGKRKILSFGASLDHQEDYNTLGLDAFLDHPLAGGNGLTIQANLQNHDGGDFLTSLPKQDALMIEAGFYSAATRLLPYVQYNRRDFDSPSRADQEKIQVGLGWMFGGHGRNLKFAIGQIATDGQDDATELQVQLQVFKF
jgi:hypothetical protein